MKNDNGTLVTLTQALQYIKKDVGVSYDGNPFGTFKSIYYFRADAVVKHGYV